MKRIEFIASLLKGYQVVLDIGTDHGLVLKTALDLGYIRRGIASDNKPGPLQQAKKNLQNYLVNFYLSDGFADITENFDLAVICGMGAHTIIHILQKAPLIPVIFLLGCQGKIYHLITWLYQNNFEIINYYYYFDKFAYIFIKAKLK